jgi:hypothetical protein
VLHRRCTPPSPVEMYSAQATNGLGVTDGSGTINPAALNSSGKISHTTGTPAKSPAQFPPVVGGATSPFRRRGIIVQLMRFHADICISI